MKSSKTPLMRLVMTLFTLALYIGMPATLTGCEAFLAALGYAAKSDDDDDSTSDTGSTSTNGTGTTGGTGSTGGTGGTGGTSSCPVGASCDDGDPTTRDDSCNTSEVCVGTAYTCPAAPQCQTSTPNGSTCDTGFLSAGTTCDDGDLATKDDACDGAGACTGTTIMCASPGQCEASIVPNGTSCTVTYKANGESCNDGDLTTKDDACDGTGACSGTVIMCASPGQCDSSIEPDGTSCKVTYKPNGESCDDGNLATKDDACDGAGTCGGTAITCPSFTQCQTTSFDGNSCVISNKSAGTTCDLGDEHTGEQCDGSGACMAGGFVAPTATERDGFDVAFVDNQTAYTCSLRVHQFKVSLYLHKIDLATGEIGPGEFIRDVSNAGNANTTPPHEIQAGQQSSIGDPAVRGGTSCSLIYDSTPVPKDGVSVIGPKIIVAYDIYTNAGSFNYRSTAFAIKDVTTGAWEFRHANVSADDLNGSDAPFILFRDGPTVKLLRVGNAYFTFFMEDDNTTTKDWVDADRYDSFEDLGALDGGVAQRNHLGPYTSSSASPESSGNPGNWTVIPVAGGGVRLRSIFWSGQHISTYELDGNGNLVTRIDDVASAIDDDSASSAVKEQSARVFAYNFLPTGQTLPTYFANLQPVFIPPYRPAIIRQKGTTTSPVINTVSSNYYPAKGTRTPQTIDVILSSSNWLIASRDPETDRVALHRIDADTYPPASDAIKPGTQLDATYCGPLVNQNASDPLAHFLEQNNFVKIAEIPGSSPAKLLVLHLTCPGSSSTADGFLKAHVIPRDFPALVDDSYSGASKGSTFNVAAPGVLGNDSTLPAGAVLGVHIQPVNGSLTLNADGGFDYTPSTGTCTGTDEFTYKVTYMGVDFLARVHINVDCT